MGLHQNTGKELLKTEEGREFAEQMEAQKFMRMDTYQEESRKRLAEIAQKLGDLDLIVIEEVKLVLRLARDILDRPGCTTRDKLDACKQIHAAAKTYNSLIYILYRKTKELGVEVEKPAPLNKPPEFEPVD